MMTCSPPCLSLRVSLLQAIDRRHFSCGQLKAEQVEILLGVVGDRGRIAASADRHNRAALQHPPQAHLGRASVVSLGNLVKSRSVRLAVS